MTPDLPPILMRDYFRRRLVPWWLAAISGSMCVALWATLAWSDPLVMKDAMGQFETIDVIRTSIGTMKMNAHLDDEEIGRIREACR